MSNFNELAKVLTLEQSKGYTNKSAVGGMETYVVKWADRVRSPTNADLVAHIVQTFEGYAQAEPTQRKAIIERALSLSRQLEPSPTQAPPRLHKPPPPPARHDARGKLAHGNATAPPPPPSTKVRDDAQPPPFAPMPDQEEAEEELPRSAPPARMDYGLDSPVVRISGVGSAKKGQLERLGIATVRDLLYHFPRAYRPLKNISELMYGDEATVVAQVTHINEYKTRSGFHIVDVVLMDMTGGITAKFFNQTWIARQFRVWQSYVISGKVDRDLNKLSFKSPEFEPLTKEVQRLLETARVYPVYPLTEGIKAGWLRKMERQVVGYWADKVTDPLPDAVRVDAHLMPLPTALREIHFPSSMPSMAAARHRFAFEELLYIQLGVLRQRQRWLQDPGRPLTIPPDFIGRFESGLPYALTGAQRRAIGEILQDLQKPVPMSRLLQGDVGAGKTVVATAALLVAILNQSQAVLMAPTEVLAEQHYRTIQKIMPALAEKFGVAPRVGLLMGSLKPREKLEVTQDLAAGRIDLAIGTHALIQESVNFANLTVAVIDEQHRFGVNQRSALRQKGFNPHVFVMSATPIPRTLALTVYGDLDLSILDELPPGRTPITTKWLAPKERERAYSFIHKQIREGRQAFVICPLIEESEAIDAKAAVEEYENLRTQVFPDLRVGLVHGKLRPVEKDAVMHAFRDHAIDILVATSVVEVGIDVPNATVMLIEGADRFGLAQLHQFRGRVGRGAHQSYCMLLAEKTGSTSDERLKVIESTQDGFKLAEADLLMRGPGEFFGTKQSGLPDLKVAQLTDVKLLEQARRIAEIIFARDPNLQAPEHQLLKKGMNEFWKGEGDLS
jgi:ATP-dependent DNA helicase RecG